MTLGSLIVNKHATAFVKIVKCFTIVRGFSYPAPGSYTQGSSLNHPLLFLTFNSSLTCKYPRMVGKEKVTGLSQKLSNLVFKTSLKSKTCQTKGWPMGPSDNHLLPGLVIVSQFFVTLFQLSLKFNLFL